jgi:hypothetical protein
MKTISDGKPFITPWWVGKRGTCEGCCTVIEFEADDQHDAHFVAPRSAIDVGWICPRCSLENRLKQYER